MCEVLFRIADKAPGQIGAALAGDVIVVCPDGHPWTVAERTNPEWRIVQFPGVDVALLRSYEVPQLDPAGGVMFKRAQGVDMTTAVGEWLTIAPQESAVSAEAVLEIIDATVARDEGAGG